MTTNYLTFMSNKLKEHELQLKGRELGVRQDELAETVRHQTAVEAENARHNVQTEEYERQRRAEEERHNKESERISQLSIGVGAGTSGFSSLASAGSRIGSALITSTSKIKEAAAALKAKDTFTHDPIWDVTVGPKAVASGTKALQAGGALGAAASAALPATLPVFMPLEVITSIVDPTGALFSTKSDSKSSELEQKFARMN